MKKGMILLGLLPMMAMAQEMGGHPIHCTEMSFVYDIETGVMQPRREPTGLSIIIGQNFSAPRDARGMAPVDFFQVLDRKGRIVRNFEGRGIMKAVPTRDGESKFEYRNEKTGEVVYIHLKQFLEDGMNFGTMDVNVLRDGANGLRTTRDRAFVSCDFSL